MNVQTISAAERFGGAFRVKGEMKIIELFRITGFTDTKVQMTLTESNNLITGTMSSET